jgi:hypothetical protein
MVTPPVKELQGTSLAAVHSHLSYSSFVISPLSIFSASASHARSILSIEEYIHFSDFQSIHIFQCKEGMDKTNVGIYIRHSQCMGTDIEASSYFFYEVMLK